MHRNLVALAASLVALTAMPASIRAYTVVNIADTTGVFSDFGDPPAIDADGIVAFRAFPKTGGYGIYTSSGATIADQSEFGGIGFLPSINADGTVAFGASLEPGDQGIFAGDGAGVATPIVNQTGPIPSRQPASTPVAAASSREVEGRSRRSSTAAARSSVSALSRSTR